MAKSTAHPPDPDNGGGDQPTRTKTGEIIREATGLGKWFTSLTTAQFQSLVLVLLTGFMCTLMGYVLYMRDKAIEGDKTRADRQLEVIMRENNSQTELTRQHCSAEMEKGRTRSELLTKDIQDTLLGHMMTERAKDREHEANRDREHRQQIKEVQMAWTAFAVKIAELERVIKKLPPEESILRGTTEAIAAAVHLAASGLNGP